MVITRAVQEDSVLSEVNQIRVSPMQSSSKYHEKVMKYFLLLCQLACIVAEREPFISLDQQQFSEISEKYNNILIYVG